MELLVCTALMIVAVAADATKPRQFADDLVYAANNTCYTTEYDIVDVHYPVAFHEENKIFLVQADTSNKTYKGTFVLHFNATTGDFRNVTARQLLEDGKCITSDGDRVYFGTTNGIYTYNFSNDAIEKYGSIVADIRDIEKDKRNDLIYIVTEDDKLYLVTERGSRMVEHDTIRNVQEIAADGKGNLYFYEKHEDPEKHLQFFEEYSKPKVLVGRDIVNITGLPDKYTNIKLVNTWNDENVILIFDNIIYTIHPNGTSVDTSYAFLDIPTACSVEAGLIQIYGHYRQLHCYKIDLSEIVKKIMKAIGDGISRYISQNIE